MYKYMYMYMQWPWVLRKLPGKPGRLAQSLLGLPDQIRNQVLDILETGSVAETTQIYKMVMCSHWEKHWLCGPTCHFRECATTTVHWV